MTRRRPTFLSAIPNPGVYISRFMALVHQNFSRTNKSPFLIEDFLKRILRAAEKSVCMGGVTYFLFERVSRAKRVYICDGAYMVSALNEILHTVNNTFTNVVNKNFYITWPVFIHIENYFAKKLTLKRPKLPIFNWNLRCRHWVSSDVVRRGNLIKIAEDVIRFGKQELTWNT